MADNKDITYRTSPDGTANPKYVDMLDEDKPLAGQKFTCVSFVSPEKIIKTRELFYFQQFLKQWDMNKSLEKFNQFLNFVAYKYNLNFDNVAKDLQDFCKDERENLFGTTVEDDYKNFIDTSEERLDEDFKREHGFQTLQTFARSRPESRCLCRACRIVDAFSS